MPQPPLLAAAAEIVPAKDRAQKKRSIPQDDDDEDLGEKAMPLTPSNRSPHQSPSKRPKLDSIVAVSDPAAIALKKKIMAATAAREPAVASLLTEYEGQSATDTTEEPECASFTATPHSPEQAHAKTGETSRKGRHSSDENNRSFGGGDAKHAANRPHDHHHKRRYGHHQEKLRWGAGADNPFSSNALRDNLYEDRNGPSYPVSWNGMIQTKKHRMNRKKRSLM